MAERDKHLRLVAGIPDGATVNLALLKLPEGALMFSAFGAAGEIDLTKPRDPHAVTIGFLWRVKRLGFKDLRFHDLRGTHETMLLDKGVPVRVVAARCGQRRGRPIAQLCQAPPQGG